jgi:AcrR family transcriptional regulator
MSPRPRKCTDDEVFAAARRAMERLGPGELTLAAVAEEAGVTAGALVQRFGSKRELMVALAERATGAPDAHLAALRAEHASPLAALRSYARSMAALAPSPAALARNLAWLQIDLTDDALRRHLATQARAARAGFAHLIEAAKRAGELRPATDAEALARIVETTLSGSLMTWATYQEGTAARWLLRDVDAILAPWLSRRRG